MASIILNRGKGPSGFRFLEPLPLHTHTLGCVHFFPEKCGCFFHASSVHSTDGDACETTEQLEVPSPLSSGALLVLVRLYPFTLIFDDTSDVDVSFCVRGLSIGVYMNLQRLPAYMSDESSTPPFLAVSRVKDNDNLIFDCATALYRAISRYSIRRSPASGSTHPSTRPCFESKCSSCPAIRFFLPLVQFLDGSISDLESAVCRFE